MKVLIPLSTILIFAVVSSDRSRRIANGRDAADGELPFVVLIVEKNSRNAGAIVNRRYVITSAVVVYAANSSELSVIAGTSDVNGLGGVVYGVENVRSHPGYDPNKSLADAVGLIRVDRDIVFTPLVRTIPLSCQPRTCVGRPATIAGWGRKDDNNSSKLQLTEVNFVSDAQCVSAWEGVPVDPRKFICTSKRFGKGLCCGDPGAPVFASGRLVGIGAFSTASETATWYPDVHTRISFYKYWIHSNTRP